MTHWIVSSKHSRDETTKDWGSKWTTDSFLRNRKFYPTHRKEGFSAGDRCLLKVLTSQDFVGDFRIASTSHVDSEDHIYYELSDVNEWEFPVNQHLLPKKYTDQLSRSLSTKISEQDFCELLGIRNFTQNLRLNYRNKLPLYISEKEIEEKVDSKNALRALKLEIVERQLEVVPGNRIDLLCQDRHGDLVVVELKKASANETIGQLARYVTDVREHKAKQGQKVRGVILSLDIDEQLVKAARGVDFDVVLCQLTLGR
jgi:hypothetical protein